MDVECRTWVLVADFDKGGWQRETLSYCAACVRHGLVPAVERSRSGNGAHVWLFFEEPVSAALARDLGSTLISEAMVSGSGMTFDSYDRLFPTQSTLRDDGLGNLIALPFQSIPMREGNSLFVDIESDFEPYADQWRFLSTVQKVTKRQAEQVVASSSQSPLGELAHADGRDSQRSGLSLWSAGSSLGKQDFSHTASVTRANMLYVRKEGVSARGLNAIRRLAAFANPEFYRAQAMHQSVYGKPRIKWCGEEDDECIMLPRGCEQRLLSLLANLGVTCQVVDKRNNGTPLRAEFTGALRPRQQEAADAMLGHECGVLSAPTGFGKTVIGAYLIASLGMRALVVVPKAVLVSQWLERLGVFLRITDDRPPLLTKSGRPSKRQRPTIGQIGGGKYKPSGLVDVATFQSLVSTDELGAPCAKPVVRDYDLVICDECQHGAAPQLELVMRSVNARRVYGLSATPRRSDGLQSIIYMHCGPIRHRVDAKEQMAEQDFERLLEPRFTHARLPEAKNGETFNEVVDKLCDHLARNRLIAGDAVSAVERGRTPMIVSRRVDHVLELARRIEQSGTPVFVLTGKGTAKERRERLEEVRTARGAFAFVATGSYVGEGFDLPNLDMLMLASPYSWEGVITQFAGRLHRPSEGKSDVLVYDYVDTCSPMLERMYKRRLKAYCRLGYVVRDGSDAVGDGASLEDHRSWRATFVADVEHAERSIAIAVPYASEKAIRLLEPSLRQACERGVDVRVSVGEPSSGEAQKGVAGAVGVLRSLGCEVDMCNRAASGIAVIDGRISWYGSLPFLGFPGADDCSLRIVNVEVAEDMARVIDALA